MWSRLARQQEDVAPPPAPAAPHQPSPPPKEEGNDEPINAILSGSDDDNSGWNDDHGSTDELLDTIPMGDDGGEGGTTAAATIRPVASTSTATDTTTYDTVARDTTFPSMGTTHNAADGWDDSLSFDDDELISPPRRPSLAAKQVDRHEKDQVVITANQGNTLGKAAERFGVALLASFEEEEQQHRQQQHEEAHDDRDGADGRGFGSGLFVMKGLSRFIEAATAAAPSHSVRVDDTGDDENQHFLDENEYEEAEGGGWDNEDDNLDVEDDFDFHQHDDDDDQHDNNNTVDNDNDVNDDILQGESDEINNVSKQSVAEEDNDEMTADEDAWEDDIDVNDRTFDSEVIIEKNDDGSSGGRPVFEGSHREHIDDDDDNTNHNILVDSYEIDKDNSPEPVLEHYDAKTHSSSLPHQDSWYINAMEGGQGGVVYSEIPKASYETTLERVQEGRVVADTSADAELVLSAEDESNVGMPISEIPSADTSPRSSNSDENIIATTTSSVPITQCELKCECLQLILPLQSNGGTKHRLPQENDGFGTKLLPDGTTVLVNYEQLLLNEATKRILLERTVESYDRTIAKLESKHQTSLQATKEKENVLNSQLAFANNEIAELKTLVSRLQHEKEHPDSESNLFESELSAALNEKDQLQNQVMFLQEELKRKDASREKNLEVQKNSEHNIDEIEVEAQSLQSNLAELQSEFMKLKTEHELLQHECDSLQEELNGKNDEIFRFDRQSSQDFADKASKAVEIERLVEKNISLKAKVESLQKELDMKAEDNRQLNRQISQSFADHATKAVEYEQACGRLENELSGTNDELTALREENESLKIIQRDSIAQINELRATIDSMDVDAGEVNQLAAEMANLKYELEAKSVEYGESTAELSRLENELSGTNDELTALREENESLKIMQRDSIAQINELRATIDSMDVDAGEVNRLAAEMANLKYELEAKSAECGESTAELSRLENELSGMNDELKALREENESLKIMQRDSDAQINELRATIDSMDVDAGEVNRLVAEMANLKYELEAKAAECGESTAELSRLENELSGMNDELTALREENESLKIMQRDSDAQINELRAKIDSMDVDTGEVNQLAAEMANLKYELEAKSVEYGESTAELSRLENELSGMNDELKALREENESLKIMQRDSDAQINELRATIDSMDVDTGEVNRLAAEMANLKYELEAKAAECNENKNALQTLQAKLDNAEECLKETMNVSDGDVEESLRADNYELSRKLVDLQNNCCALEISKSDLQRNLEEKSRSMESFETQIKSLNEQLLETSQLQQDILDLRQSLEDKSRECNLISSKAEELQVALHCAQTNHSNATKEISDLSEEKLSKLRAQITDLLTDHNVMIQSMEERLDDASNQIMTLSAECNDYRLKLECSKTECTRFVDIVSKLEREKFELSSALELARSALAENQMEASRSNTSIYTIKEEMESINHQNRELVERNQALLREKADTVKALEAKSSELEQERKLFETSHKANSEAQQIILDLEKQLQDIKTTNKRLESELFEASFEVTEESRLSDDNDALIKEREQLIQEVQVLRDRVNELSHQTVDNSVEREALQTRISNLEADLRTGNSSDLRDELAAIQQEREQLDQDNEELLVQLGLMQQDKLENEAARQVEIESLREQISNLKEKCDRLQKDLHGGSSSSSELNNRELVERLQEEIHHLNESQRKKSIAFNEDISLLKLKLSDKENEVMSVKEQMQNALNEKDEEIVKLRAEFSVNEEEINEEIEAEPSYEDQATNTEEGKECCRGDQYDDEIDSLQGLLAEEADSDDFLRCQIVILAQALERAELHRAEALERIITERKSNADIVSQLGDSVKRFYSSIRRSEGL